jgi:hypothetical protein
MARVEQPKCERGSQKWLQLAVNSRPAVLNDLIIPKLAATSVSWQSPLAADQYAEYRDADFLEKIGASSLSSELANFWPDRGPQWDALARSDRGDILLVEAKAHIEELFSPPTKAGPTSRKKIEEALDQAARNIGATPRAPWTELFYQLANRITHLYFLRKHGLKACLVLVNFLGDSDMGGPENEREWRAAYQVVWYALGIPSHHILQPFILEIYPQIEKLA